jgi:iron complex transport system ATP-binding protein
VNAVLALESVTAGYGGRPVLDGVSLAVAPGEVLALIGPNGAGKSTLIRAASGLMAPARGRVTVDGEDVHRLRPQVRARKVAVVPQAARLPEAFTVLDTVLMGRTAYLGWVGRETEADREAASAAMRRTSILDLAERRIGDLSGGEQQLVLVARALAQSAPVLLMDEPTAHLDLGHQARILGLVQELARGGELTVLIALHDLNLAAQYAGRAALLAGGRLRAVGTPADVLTEANVSGAYGVPVKVLVHPASGTPLIVPAPPGRTQAPRPPR